MSASLVGSEMCIRDSFSPSVCGAQRTATNARNALRQRKRLPRTAQRRSCLLYTSDAADDM
eukprot:15065031-Alexandrium_andersonii.AAC.1